VPRPFSQWELRVQVLAAGPRWGGNLTSEER
jgi:hypothetical protein